MIRHRVLQATGRWVTRHPTLVLTVCLLSAVACVVLTARTLEFSSDRDKLVNPELDWNRRYRDFKDNFPRWDDVIICLDGPAEDPELDALARRLAETLRELPHVQAADAGFQARDAGPRLFRISDEQSFQQRLAELAAARSLASAENANQALALATAGLQQQERQEPEPTGEDPLGRLESMLDPYLQTLEGGQPDFGWLDPARSAEMTRWEPFRSDSGRLRFIQVRLRQEGDGVDNLTRTLASLRATVADLLEQWGGTHVAWGVTGIPAIEADETAQSIRDSTIASILAVVLITVLMIVVFRGLTVPLLAAGSLLIGMAWSFGWLIVSVGHLQLLSVVFTVILLGLGIDYALHIVARLELIREEEEELSVAVARVFGGVGPGLITGAVTTAAAFGAIAFTDFLGMAEMGIIAAGGVLLCLVAMCSAFPAALATTRWRNVIRHRHGGEHAHFGWARLDWHPSPALVLALAAVVVATLIGLATRVRYDPNVLNLQSTGVESVAWEARIVEDSAMSVWAALVRTRPEDAATRTDALRAEEQVSDVGSIGMLFPPDRAQREQAVSAVREADATLPAADADHATMLGQLGTIQFGLRGRLRDLEGEPRGRVERLVERLTAAIGRSGALGDAQRQSQWRSLDEAFKAVQARLRQSVDTALAPGPLTAYDLPEVLRAQWVGADGSWLLRIFPNTDAAGRSILDPDRLEAFVGAVRVVEPEVFGPPVQIYESSLLIVREYIRAAIYAIAVILVALLVDFGALYALAGMLKGIAGAGGAARAAADMGSALADAVSALLPVVIGFIGAFGIMGLFGAPLNFANIIVMPIIFGIGAAAGVHVVHRWRVEPWGRPSGLCGGTGRGVTLTMVTTMIGFGCMLVAEHRGIRSLGLVMLGGLGVTLLACYTVLPAVLQLRDAGQNGGRGIDEGAQTP
ncbi:MAG: MMPL family transporter [Planctomycetota bacterium]